MARVERAEKEWWLQCVASAALIKNTVLRSMAEVSV